MTTLREESYDTMRALQDACPRDAGRRREELTFQEAAPNRRRKLTSVCGARSLPAERWVSEKAFQWRAGGEKILDPLPILQIASPMNIGGTVADDADRAWACRFDVPGTPYVTRLATADGAAVGWLSLHDDRARPKS